MSDEQTPTDVIVEIGTCIDVLTAFLTQKFHDANPAIKTIVANEARDCAWKGVESAIELFKQRMEAAAQ